MCYTVISEDHTKSGRTPPTLIAKDVDDLIRFAQSSSDYCKRVFADADQLTTALRQRAETKRINDNRNVVNYAKQRAVQQKREQASTSGGRGVVPVDRVEHQVRKGVCHIAYYVVQSAGADASLTLNTIVPCTLLDGPSTGDPTPSLLPTSACSAHTGTS